MALFPNKQFGFFTGVGDYSENPLLFNYDYRYHFDLTLNYGFTFSGVSDNELCNGIFRSIPINYKEVFIQDLIINQESFFLFIDGGNVMLLRSAVAPVVYGKAAVLIGTGSDVTNISIPPVQPFFPDAINDFKKHCTYFYRLQAQNTNGNNLITYPINETFKMGSVKNFLNIGLEFCLADPTNVNDMDFTRYVAQIEQDFFMYTTATASLFGYVTFLNIMFNGKVT